MSTLERASQAVRLHESGVAPAVVGLIAFLTLVDLFAAQAILPSLVAKFEVSRATMGFAVNASTFGMAVAGIAVALFGGSIDRRSGIWISLAALSVPTAMLAFTDSIALFALLRVAQGIFMSAAFTLTIAYLGEHLPPETTAGALAAYVTGNVASNFFGRVLSAALADSVGVEGNFLSFAALNLAGAALVAATLSELAPSMPMAMQAVWRQHLADRRLRTCFALGFLILFVFIGTFTYVNFELVRPPLGLSPMGLGLVYLVFLPSLLTTPLAGRIVARIGVRSGLFLTLMLAMLGLAMLLAPSLPIVLAGMTSVAAGTFLAQAIATGHVGRIAKVGRASASGIYLACYYAGGLVGSFLLGQVYDGAGWSACVAVLAAATAAAATLALAVERGER